MKCPLCSTELRQQPFGGDGLYCPNIPKCSLSLVVIMRDAMERLIWQSEVAQAATKWVAADGALQFENELIALVRPSTSPTDETMPTEASRTDGQAR